MNDTHVASDVDAAFIIRTNIEHYRKMLAGEIDEAKRQTLLDLVTEEEAKLKELSPN